MKYLYSSIKLLVIFCSITFFASISANNSYAVNSEGVWKQVGSLNLARWQHGSSALNNGKIIITGGSDGVGYLKSSEIYNPLTKEWIIGPNSNEPRYNPSGAKIIEFSDNNIFVAGGEKEGITPVKTSEIYNPSTNNWELKAELNTARFYSILAPLSGDRALIATGGSGYGQKTNTAEIYDYATDNWRYTGNLNIARQINTGYALLDDGRILVAGGNSDAKFAENTAEVFDPITETWTMTGNIPFDFDHGSITKLNNGKILIVGSLAGTYPNITSLPNAAVFDPNTNNWTEVAPMPTPRSEHDAILLEDGNVLVFGGVDDNNAYYLETLIYSPTTDTWSSGPDMPDFYRLGSVTKLQNGDYLIAGGYNGTDWLTTSFIFTNDNGGNDNDKLDVPLIKQVDANWGNDTYDFAKKWSPKNPYIKNWGCTLTSAVMVLNYYGYEKLPDGTELNPGTLNQWLIQQPDGFTRNGLVNWDPLKRLSRMAKDINNIEFAALDFERINSNNQDVLKSNLENEVPTILEVSTSPGSSHFIVATGYQDNIFTINDPGQNYDSLSSYGNTFKSMRLFKPSNTDLSAIKIVTNENVKIDVTKKNNGEKGEEYIQNPIKNNLGEDVSGESLNYFYINDPEGGKYNVRLSSDKFQKINIDFYVYDKNANVKVKKYKSFISKYSDKHFVINFKKMNAEKTKIYKTYPNIMKWFKNKKYYNSDDDDRDDD